MNCRAEPELGPGGDVNPLQGSGGVRGSGEVVDDEEFYDTIDHIDDDNNDQGMEGQNKKGFFFVGIRIIHLYWNA